MRYRAEHLDLVRGNLVISDKLEYNMGVSETIMKLEMII